MLMCWVLEIRECIMLCFTSCSLFWTITSKEKDIKSFTVLKEDVSFYCSNRATLFSQLKNTNQVNFLSWKQSSSRRDALRSRLTASQHANATTERRGLSLEAPVLPRGDLLFFQSERVVTVSSICAHHRSEVR